MKLSATAILSIVVGIIAAATVVVVANKDESSMNAADASNLIDGSIRKLRDTALSNFEMEMHQEQRALIADDDDVESDRMLLRTTYDYGSMTKDDPKDEEDENQFRVRKTFDGERRLMSSKMGKKKMDKKMKSGKKGKDKSMKKMKMGMMKSSKSVGPDAASMKMMKSKKDMSMKKGKGGKMMKSKRSKEAMKMKSMKKYDTN